MGYEELIDTLISEGHQKVTLFCGRLRTDDGSAEVHFITSEDGDTVARNLHEAGGHSGWTLCDWPVSHSADSNLQEIWPLDLSNREESLSLLCFFS
ncbi:TPA: hypothetical protein I3313_004992 [Enterobacter hormaechei subsp. hoffmannii]|uniref:hypothetical protein n=1 Tax=Enterobacter TaxID=547 RepID=UPI0007987D91|nr:MULTISPECIES: hypothetical protein [Enterobacter]MCA2405452.1 hypothetical protein [Enterobacter sp. CCUG 70166]SAC51187.1 Uncharacterised protein [Enterobacter hormaechei]HAS0829937.1 hypothetical protein [Enterobacter hormaechei subsp. hoffmannii]HAT7668849.1 hypothetical protein [Enterobacter hormaechei subsp. hoffmannii]